MNDIKRDIFIKCYLISSHHAQLLIYTYKSDKDKDAPFRELYRTTYLDTLISKP